MSNAIEVKISTAKIILQKMVRKTLADSRGGNKMKHSPIYLHSSPGLGKSSIVRQATEELDIGFVDIRLSQMEQSEVAGIPYVSHAGDETETMKMSVPTWFPSKAKIKAGECPKEGVIFFDELSNAAIGVQHAAYGIILDREVHGVKLGDGWQIVAAGNKKEDKTGAKGVAPALANRFGTHIFIRPDMDDFITYAVGARLNPEINGFINFKTNALYQFDPTKNDVAFATPRSWEQVSYLIDCGFDNSEFSIALAGCIGVGLANDFMAFRKYYSKLPNFTDIMEGKSEYKVPKDDMGMTFAISSSLTTAIVEHSDNAKYLKNLTKVMVQLEDDFLTMIYKTLQRNGESVNVSNIIMHTTAAFNRVSKQMKKLEEA